ncbi:UDP-N-acetylglucosamine 4,6-dehydratase family protein [Massilibacteroides vaginae]|uniref:UDP-N-acetylglucosamine 4,6-dehydratase family protein n=1 Tax=Massilibacteroides vaginae TaxID=1673718 RepID=UPI000A1CC2B8|nr:nucleoside-diphosphate sugar epimerase/dehydratase [Massilibacteroides vaginae]
MFTFLIRIFSAKYLSRWLILLNDLLISTLSSVGAFLLTCFVFARLLTWQQFICIGLFSAFSSLVSFYSFKIYKGVIRHSSFSETGRIALAVILKVTLLAVIVFFLLPHVPAPFIYITILLDFLITFFALITLRAVMIMSYNHLVRTISISKGNILVFKSDLHEKASMHSSFPDTIGEYHMVGFLQFGGKDLYRINSYNVFVASGKEEFAALQKKHQIKAVLFQSDREVKNERDRLVRYCEALKVRMLILSPINEFNKHKGFNRPLAEVRVEDLLSRDEIEINLEEIGHELNGKIVMVTGAAGSIGSEICRQLCSFPIKHLVLFDSAETPMHNLRLELNELFPQLTYSVILGDVRNATRVNSIFKCYQPQIVFHAAAYKHVPLMEENPCEAIRTNLYGTRVVADASIKHKAEKFVMISTDKAVNPTNVMGASKRLAEMYVQSLNGALKQGILSGSTRFVTTRFGNVLGSNGSVIPLFREQIAKGGPVTVTHPDIIRYFMTIPEACRLVLEAGTMGQGGEIFVFDMGEPVKIVDLANRMISLAGLEAGKDIQIKFSGLRPGEKLYEEVLSAQETTLPTPHEKIRVASVRDCCYQQLLPEIDELIQVAHTTEIVDTVRKMKEIIPEFISKNSVFEELDKELKGKAV